MEDLLNPKQAGKTLGVSAATINRLADAGEIEYHRVGTQRRYSPEDIRRYLDRVKSKAEVAQ